MHRRSNAAGTFAIGLLWLPATTRTRRDAEGGVDSTTDTADWRRAHAPDLGVSNRVVTPTSLAATVESPSR